MTKKLTILLFTLFMGWCLAGCSDAQDDGQGSSQEDDNNQQDNNQEPEPEVFDLDACSSLGGGRLNETQCNKGWDCAGQGSFEILCNGNGEPETCSCRRGQEEVATFTASEAGGFCDAFSTGDFAANVVEMCGFPEGRASQDEDEGNEGENNTQEFVPQEGFAEPPEVTCVGEMMGLDVLYYDEVASANVLTVWTDNPTGDELDTIVWAEYHATTLTDASTQEQAATEVSLSLQTDASFDSGLMSLLDCTAWNTQATIILRLDDTAGDAITCVALGHDVAGVIGGEYDLSILTTFGFGGEDLLEGCVFEDL